MTEPRLNLNVRVQADPIGEGTIRGLADPSCGAVATFRGVVRADGTDRRVEAIEYECYREMAEREMLAVLNEVASSHAIAAATIVHRSGIVRVGETSVLVAVAAPHRAAVFDALRAIVDEIKRRAPIWKKEHYDDGEARWL